MKKLTFFWLILLLFILTGCTHAVQKQSQQAPNENQSSVITPKKQEINTQIREIAMTVRQWEFEPQEIIVKKGESIKLIIKNEDVSHGIFAPELGIDQFIEAGKTTTVEFTADKVGEFSYFCNVACGKGHKDMTGKIIVQE